MAAIKRNSFKFEQVKWRRRPQQERAEKTVERIMNTTLDLTLKEGYSSLTTNRIARESKVNISSLYQYFPNVYAIVLAIYEQAASELASVIHELMMKELTTPMETGLPRIIKTLVNFIDSRQAVFLRLEREVPELRRTSTQMSIDKMAYQMSCIYIKQHMPELSEATIKSRLFYCNHICVALVHGFLVDRPKGVSRAQLINALCRLITDCLKNDISR